MLVAAISQYKDMLWKMTVLKSQYIGTDDENICDQSEYY